jgi:hypothetical protein
MIPRLKVPKREIFVTEDLGNEAKHTFFKVFKADIRHFLFSDDSVVGKNYSMHTERSLKIFHAH